MFSVLRIRSAARDEETDNLRFNTLTHTLDLLDRELRAERRGLKERCERLAATAAFAQERFESNGSENSLSTRIDDMTQSMKAYTRRMETLQRQSELVQLLRSTASDFAGTAEKPETVGLRHAPAALRTCLSK
ncbi:hypothetical protein ACFPOD_03500 [Nitratireductor kimnyeongensis]|uniref:Uncharacterized protein n=1 Tax=Nitratireductor kimnyeongensis TaxID=430679 RepID=A0ABW0T496_9HYPH|nr:hypothetical protein [Nitratireductor kimnyeongensis]QZZ34833.1 hypothetical protein KW403_13685 [Nitratireductor kimnyeongensis]